MARSKNPGLRVVNPDCAGIDIGKDRHFVAVEAERSEEPVVRSAPLPAWRRWRRGWRRAGCC